MNSNFFSVISLVFIFLISTSVDKSKPVQEFQARAYYFSKSKMELGNWGARLSEAQKKEIGARKKLWSRNEWRCSVCFRRRPNLHKKL